MTEKYGGTEIIRWSDQQLEKNVVLVNALKVKGKLGLWS